MKLTNSCRAHMIPLLTITAALFLAVTPGMYASPPTDAPPNISTFVLYAERSVRLGEHNRVGEEEDEDDSQGDIGVRSAAASGGTQVMIGRNSHLPEDRSVFSPSVSLDDDAVAGNLETDSLQNNGGHFSSQQSFPASTMPSLPLAPAPAAGGPAVTVPPFQTVTLQPGSYGDLVVGGRVRLNPGSYSFSSVTLSNFARLEAEDGGVQIAIAGAFTTGKETTISTDSDERADQLNISVSGSDGATGTPAVTLGEHSKIRALLAAPNGTISFGEEMHAKGAFAGFDIVADDHVDFDFESGFSASSATTHGQQQLVGYFSSTIDPGIAQLVGPVPANTNIRLAIGLPVTDPQGLKDLIGQVSDPKDPNFRKFLTPAQFYATYGATNSDYQSLQNWAVSNGFTINATYPNNLLLSVTGTAAQIEKALFVNLNYRLRKDGSQFVAVDREPSLDLTVPLLHISGLSDFAVPKFNVTLNGTGFGNNYRAADIRNAYLGVGSSCQQLDGTGQVVGLLETDIHNASDVQNYDALQIPPRNPARVSIAVTEGGNPPALAKIEATVDVEMVQAMAPNAQILVFQGNLGITFHFDDILAAMATSTPQLTVAATSLGFGRSDNSQQSLDEMAAQGTTFFAASGDKGDVGDPQDSGDMDSQTLVGGTFLSTNPLISPLPTPVYPANYYAGDATWNGNGPLKSNNATGGGIMDGNNKDGNCFCWPHDFCCGKGVIIPHYQVGVSMATNGGSTQWRNYPDVAILAANPELFVGGPKKAVGTSISAPLWAGLMTLVNQRNGTTTGLGFMNPTFYDIGLTSGLANDLYSACFNDVNDQVTNANGFGAGFKSVAGYDLTTGWGTPKCQLINQIASPTPLTPNSPLDLVEIVTSTGNDNLRGNGGIFSGCRGTGATADILLKGGGTLSFTLKATNTSEEFANNTTQTPFHFALPSNLNPPLTPSNGIAGIRINIQEAYDPPCTADNWDITNLSVSLFNPGSPTNPSGTKVCQLNLIGNSLLQDGSIGLVRLSESAGSSGNGPSATFMTGPNSGCP